MENKVLIEHIHNSNWRLFTQKETRFAISLILVFKMFLLEQFFFQVYHDKIARLFSEALESIFSVPTSQTGVNPFP